MPASSAISIGDQILAAQYNNLRTDALSGWARLYNKSGGTLNAGDVVVVDSSNDSAFTTTASVANNTVLGVLSEETANNAQGYLYPSGAVITVNVFDVVTRGHYLETSTTAGKAHDAGAVLNRGVFGMALTGHASAGAGTVKAMMFYSKTARGGFPTGLIVLYDAACPSGWSRFTPLDGKYPKGAATYGGTGGAATHTHEYSDLPIHTHTHNESCGSGGSHSHGSGTLATNSTGSHSHTYSEVVGGYAIASGSGYAEANNATSSNGSHSHSIGGSVASGGSHSHGLNFSIDNAGTATPCTTASANSEPPYLEMIFCKKD